MKTGFYFCSILMMIAARSVFGQATTISTNAVVLTPQYIDSLAEEARTNHPALRAADVRADAAVWNAAAIRAWEDPTAKFGVRGADRKMRAEDGDLIFGVEQKLPLFGKPQAMRAVAQAEALTQRQSATFRALELRNALTKQLIKVALEERELELSCDDLASLDLIVETTEEKYRNALSTQVEVLQSQNERARRDNLLRTEEALLVADSSSLNRFLSRNITSAWPRLTLPTLVSNLPPADLMIEHATTMAPQLDIVRASLVQAKSAERLAHKQRLPEVSVGVEGRQFSDSGEFREGTVLLGLSLPWGNRSRYVANIRREQRKAEAAQLDIADLQLTLRDEVTRLAIQIENSAREVKLYRNDIIPRTETALSSAHANWLNNRGTLRDVLEARRMLLDAQTMEARALADQHTMLADLLLHCGLGDLRDLSTLHPTPAATPTRTTP